MSIGTGLGRDLRLIDEWSTLLSNLNKKQVVCDADFFWYFTQNIFQNLNTMKKGKKWVFTPNKREFTKIFSFLNKKSFGFGIIDQFLAELDEVLDKLQDDRNHNQVFESRLGEDGNGDGVFSCENLSDSEKTFNQLIEQTKEFQKGTLGSKTIKTHPIGKLVNVISNSK